MRLPLLLAVLSMPASAQGPTGPFPDCAPDNRSACPRDLSWTDTSWIPDGSTETVHPGEQPLGSGIRLDRALRHTSGRWDVSVAIIDSGIDWADNQIAAKVRINLDEVPAPQHADGSPVEGGDLDGNGIVNVWDWAEDPRVDITDGVDATDDRLEPSDLIAAFSDGVDDDANGYVDDIAGWDFFEHDNNPYASFARGFYDHGTGVAKIAAAWADDGGDLGACPDCSILPLRIGEAFVTDGDRLALALAYAGDARAGGASLAVGAITLPDTAKAAATYAAERGVVLVGAGGDENSWHRNMPSGDPNFLFVKSVRANDRKEKGGATSFFATWNCNNFGPRMDLVAPATECATGATARIAGLAGLLRSAAREREIDVTARGLRTLLKNTATDVALPDAVQGELELLPSRPGWDGFHGYGRVNAESSLDRLLAGDLPELRLDEPKWFSWSRDGDVTVRGSADGAWRLEVGIGGEPRSWEEVASGAAGPVEVDVQLPRAETDFVDLDVGDDLLARYARAHEPMVQLRLVSGDVEERRGLWVHEDPDLKPGFPVQFAGSIDSGPNLADLDGDGVFEIIISTASGVVRVLDGTGSPVAGWDGLRTGSHPHRPGPGAWEGIADLREGLMATPAVGDLDGDGTVEIVVAGLAGGLYVGRDGGLTEIARIPRPDMPLSVGFAWDAAVLASPVLVQLDAEDPRKHILIGDGSQRLWLFTPDGEVVDGYPLRVCHPSVCGVAGARIVASPSVADIDGDGDLDAAVPTGEVPDGAAGVIHLVDLESATLTASLEVDGLINSTLLPVIGEGHPASVALGDLDGDGDLELVTAAMLSNIPPTHHSGDEALPLTYATEQHGGASNLDSSPGVQMANAPVMGDLNADGVPDVVSGAVTLDFILSLARTRYGDHQHGTFAWSGATGEALRGFPRQVDGPAFLTAPALADVNGDDQPEVVSTSTSHFVYAHDASGALASGFPKFHGGWAMGGPALGDIDGDGLRDLVLTTREGLIFAWTTAAPADGPAPWPMPHHDSANTGSLTTPLPPQEGPRKGCGGCNGGVGGVWISGLALVLLLRRRSVRRVS